MEFTAPSHTRCQMIMCVCEIFLSTGRKMILPTQKLKCHIWMNQTEDFLQHPGPIAQKETHNRKKLKYCLPLSVDSVATAAAYCNLNFLHTLSADYQMTFREMLLWHKITLSSWEIFSIMKQINWLYILFHLNLVSLGSRSKFADLPCTVRPLCI